MLMMDGRQTTEAGDYHPIRFPGALGSGELKSLDPCKMGLDFFWIVLERNS